MTAIISPKVDPSPTPVQKGGPVSHDERALASFRDLLEASSDKTSAARPFSEDGLFGWRDVSLEDGNERSHAYSPHTITPASTASAPDGADPASRLQNERTHISASLSAERAFRALDLRPARSGRRPPASVTGETGAIDAAGSTNDAAHSTAGETEILPFARNKTASAGAALLAERGSKSSVFVALQALELGVRVVARVGSLNAAERERLRTAIKSLLVEHGLAHADVEFHEHVTLSAPAKEQ